MYVPAPAQMSVTVMRRLWLPTRLSFGKRDALPAAERLNQDAFAVKLNVSPSASVALKMQLNCAPSWMTVRLEQRVYSEGAELFLTVRLKVICPTDRAMSETFTRML